MVKQQVSISVKKIHHGLGIVPASATSLSAYLEGSPKSGILVSKDMSIYTRQQRLQIARVNHYLRLIDSGEDMSPVTLCQDEQGRYWHLDGLHRIVAHRIHGLNITAQVWMG